MLSDQLNGSAKYEHSCLLWPDATHSRRTTLRFRSHPVLERPALTCGDLDRAMRSELPSTFAFSRDSNSFSVTELAPIIANFSFSCMMKSIGRIWTTFATLTWNFWMNLLHNAVTSIVGPCSRRISSS